MLPNQGPEKSNLIESLQDFNEDGWNNEEIFQHCRYQKYCSFFATLISIVLIILPFIFYESYPIDSALVFGVLGIMSFLISFFSYIWAVYFMRNIQNPNKNEISKLGSALFFFTTFILIAFVLMFMIASINITVYHNELLAIGSLSLSSFDSDVNSYGFIMICVFLLLSLFLGYISFSLYICSVNETFNRMLLNVYLIIFLFFNLALIYLSTQISDLLETRALQRYCDPWYATLGLIMGIIGAILSFACIFINVRRWRIGYLVVGSTLLIFIAIGLVFGGMVHRKADSIQEGYETNCLNDMKSINSADLENAGCPSKYLKNTVYYNNNSIVVYLLECENSEKTLVWENEQSKGVLEKVNALACLNINCCNVMGNIYSLWFYGLAYTLISMSVFSFCCVCCLYSLSIKASLGRNILIKSDYLFWALMLLMVLSLVLMTQFYKADSLQEEEYIVTSQVLSKYDLQFQVNSNTKIYSSNGQTCEFFYNLVENKTDYSKMIDFNESCIGPYCGNSAVLRLALTGNGNFTVANDYNTEDLKFFDKNYGKEFFPNETSTDFDYMIFEGYSENIDDFLKNTLKFCVNNYLIPAEFSYVKYSYIPQSYNTSNFTNQATVALQETTKIAKTVNSHKNNQKKHEELSTYYQLAYNAESILDSYAFGNLKVYVYDSSTTNTLSQVELILVKATENTTCQSSIPTPFQRGVSDNNGFYSFYNVLVRDYYIYAIAENYKCNCKKISNISVFDNSNVHLVLIPDFLDFPMKVFLFWNNPSVWLSLQSTFNYNEKEMCVAGYYQTQCGNMISSQTSQSVGIGEINYQEIDIKLVGNYTYLFYVQKLQSGDALTCFELEQMGNFTNSTNLTVDNSDFNQADPYIQIYTQELKYPVKTLNAPIISESDKIEPDLIWLGFCFNGTVGEVSNQEIQKIWTKVDANATFYNRLYSYKNMLPDAGICKGVY